MARGRSGAPGEAAPESPPQVLGPEWEDGGWGRSAAQARSSRAAGGPAVWAYYLAMVGLLPGAWVLGPVAMLVGGRARRRALADREARALATWAVTLGALETLLCVLLAVLGGVGTRRAW